MHCGRPLHYVSLSNKWEIWGMYKRCLRLYIPQILCLLWTLKSIQRRPARNTEMSAAGVECWRPLVTVCENTALLLESLCPCRIPQLFIVCVGLRQGYLLSPFFFLFYMNWIDSHTRVDQGLLEAAGSTVCFLHTIWCCLHSLNRAFNMHVIGILLRANKL